MVWTRPEQLGISSSSSGGSGGASGGTPHKPYPKHVWSPSGGWWAQPKQWKRNTLIVGAGITAFMAFVFVKSAELEQRTLYPRVWIPSMIWSKQFKV
ncbi:hypothetical protein LPJ61_003804 [Coemansia biformis]|uniref:Uncharacterized protein n=1 Tax=Coemansia biformis TaxID=1286918 RepID=A0A9W8CV95_9FUNG|nr:hypothetical protein LPJ61_003804 [Coemansia biformis]